MSAPYELFAACVPGLEPLLDAELRELGALAVERRSGGVAFRGHRRVIYRVNLESGLATHVLLRLAHFTATSFEHLERALEAIPWEDVLTGGSARTFRVTAQKSRLYHSGAIAERAERAVAKRIGNNTGEGDAVPIALRLFHDRVQVSLDTSGDPLHRRGYRLTSGPAPLREDLAFALVKASGWDPSTPLVDPLCGTGTIAIEAAGLAARLAPGRQRSFAFERTRLLDQATWADVREASVRAAREPPTVLGRDRDERAIVASRANAKRAGVSPRFEVASLREPLGIDRPEGALVTNPPYGRRIGKGENLVSLYRALGRFAAELPDAWKIAVLCMDRRLGLRVRHDLRTAFLTDAGGVKVRALVR